MIRSFERYEPSLGDCGLMRVLEFHIPPCCGVVELGLTGYYRQTRCEIRFAPSFGLAPRLVHFEPPSLIGDYEVMCNLSSTSFCWPAFNHTDQAVALTFGH